MHLLKPYLTELRSFTSLVKEVHGFKITLGVFLDLNPDWFVAYQLHRAGLRWDDIEWWFYHASGRRADMRGLDAILGSQIWDGYIDLNWRVPGGWAAVATF